MPWLMINDLWDKNKAEHPENRQKNIACSDLLCLENNLECIRNQILYKYILYSVRIRGKCVKKINWDKILIFFIVLLT